MVGLLAQATIPLATAAPPGAASWVATWSASPQPPVVPQEFNNQTLRLIVHTTLGGAKVRIRVSNAFGNLPLVIGDAGATLTPFEGSLYYTTAGEAERQAVNQFIRSSGAFDRVIGFDAVVRDPNNPSQLLPAYDSGDHLHPNVAGYQAMVQSIDVSLFFGGR